MRSLTSDDHLTDDERAFFYGEDEDEVARTTDPFNILARIEEDADCPLIHLQHGELM